MKAQEFSANIKSKVKPVVLETAAIAAPAVVQEKKLMKKHKVAAAPAVATPLYGVDDPNGAEVRRLRSQHPEIYKKLQNWD